MFELDFLTIFIAAFIGTIFQLLWRSSFLFGKIFPAESRKQKLFSFFTTFASLFVMASILSFLEMELKVTSFFDGFFTGALFWIGFVLTNELFFLKGKILPLRLFLLSITCQGITLMIIGGVLVG